MTSNVTLQTARQLSGLMVFRAVHKRCISRPPKQKATKCHASASCQCLATYTIHLKRKKSSFFIYYTALTQKLSPGLVFCSIYSTCKHNVCVISIKHTFSSQF